MPVTSHGSAEGNRLSSCGLNEFTIFLERFKILLSQLNLANAPVKSCSKNSLQCFPPPLDPLAQAGSQHLLQSRVRNMGLDHGSVWNTPPVLTSGSVWLLKLYRITQHIAMHSKETKLKISIPPITHLTPQSCKQKELPRAGVEPPSLQVFPKQVHVALGDTVQG